MSNPDLENVIVGTLSRICGDDQQAYADTYELFTGAQVQYFVQDQFITIAVLTTSAGLLLGAGASKRNPIDKPNNLRGRAIALSRAVRSAVQTNFGDK